MADFAIGAEGLCAVTSFGLLLAFAFFAVVSCRALMDCIPLPNDNYVCMAGNTVLVKADFAVGAERLGAIACFGLLLAFAFSALES